MANANEKTLKAYEEKLDEYIASVPQEVVGDLKEWIDMAVSYLPQKANILEIGAGFGRDADYIETFDHRVVRTDAAQSFVGYLHNKGHSAQVLNVLQDKIPSGFDMVFADAVFLHFTSKQLTNVFKKVYNSLDTGGILAFTVKYGKGSEWTNARIDAPRFYRYWKPAALAKKLESAGFIVMSMQVNGSRNWVQVIAQK